MGQGLLVQIGKQQGADGKWYRPKFRVKNKHDITFYKPGAETVVNIDETLTVYDGSLMVTKIKENELFFHDSEGIHEPCVLSGIGWINTLKHMAIFRYSDTVAVLAFRISDGTNNTKVYTISKGVATLLTTITGSTHPYNDLSNYITILSAPGFPDYILIFDKRLTADVTLTRYSVKVSDGTYTTASTALPTWLKSTIDKATPKMWWKPTITAGVAILFALTDSNEVVKATYVVATGVFTVVATTPAGYGRRIITKLSDDTAVYVENSVGNINRLLISDLSLANFLLNPTGTDKWSYTLHPSNPNVVISKRLISRVGMSYFIVSEHDKTSLAKLSEYKLEPRKQSIEQPVAMGGAQGLPTTLYFEAFNGDSIVITIPLAGLSTTLYGVYEFFIPSTEVDSWEAIV